MEAIRDVLAPTVPSDYDLIALCDPSWEDGLRPRFVCPQDAHEAEALLGALPGGLVAA